MGGPGVLHLGPASSPQGGEGARLGAESEGCWPPWPMWGDLCWSSHLRSLLSARSRLAPWCRMNRCWAMGSGSWPTLFWKATPVVFFESLWSSLAFRCCRTVSWVEVDCLGDPWYHPHPLFTDPFPLVWTPHPSSFPSLSWVYEPYPQHL